MKKIEEKKFDVVKVSHHGSIKNTSNELAEIICSERYLISSNGIKHNHPDPQTLIKLLAANKNFKKQLYFNYRTENSSVFEKNELQKKYNYEIIYGSDEEYLVIEL